MSAVQYASSSSSSSASTSTSSKLLPRVTKVDRILFQSNQPSSSSKLAATSSPSLELTPHHFVLRFPPSEGDASDALQIPYTLINTLVRLPSLPTSDRHVRIFPLGLRLRTFEIYALGFDTEALATDVFETVKQYAVLRSPEQLYAFKRERTTSPANGWRFYDVKKEFSRQGIGSRTKAWRFTDVNNQYAFSPTYPSQLVVPSRISDQTLNYAAKYRSKARVPALTYLHWANYGSITRCSQPLVGLKGNRSVQDEKLVEAIFSSHIFADPSSKAAQAAAAASAAASQSGGVAALGPSAGMVIYGATSTNLIVDARPTTNAMANVAKGAGSENMEHYRGCKKAYLGIENIHVMRDSLNRMTEALKDAAVPVTFSTANTETSSSLLDRAGTLNGTRPGSTGASAAANGSVYATYRPGRQGNGPAAGAPVQKPLDTLALKRSNWLKHIAALLEGTMMIVRNVHINSSHVLIHCSDGWDRTSQLAALAQICLDPFFRTIDGLAVLIEKDWLSFGHRFEDRSGHLGHPSRFITDPGHGEPPAGEDWDEDGREGPGAIESEGFEAQAAVNAIWGFTKQLTAGFSGGGGSGSSSSPTNLREISPVFHQFLDCVWQLLRQFPTRFEYNAAFLVELHRKVYACEHGTFLLNSERERHALGTDDGKVISLEQRTPSVWDELFATEETRKRWVNDKYDPSLDSTAVAGPADKTSAVRVDTTPSSASPKDEKSESDACSTTSTATATLVSDSASSTPSGVGGKHSGFGDMGVLLANPREVRFFGELFRRDEREMNALIVAEAQERARYAQRLADAAAGASAAKEQARVQAAAAAAAAEGGIIPVPTPIAVEGGSADPGRDPAAAEAAATLGAGASSSPIEGVAGGRAGAVDLGTTLSASRLDGTRLAYQPRIPRQPSATMPRSMSGVALSSSPAPSTSSSTTATSSYQGGASASSGPAGEMSLDEAGAKMKNLFLGGWGRLQNAIASAGQAAAAPTAPAPGQSPSSNQAPPIPPAWMQQGQARGPAGRPAGPEGNPWSSGGTDSSNPFSEEGKGRSGGTGKELGMARPSHQQQQAPLPPPSKDRDASRQAEPGYLQSATLTSNPWAAAAAASFASSSSGRTQGSHLRLEDVFGAEQARSRPGATTTMAGSAASPSLTPSAAGVQRRSPSPSAGAGRPAEGASYPPPSLADKDAERKGQGQDKSSSAGGGSYDPLGALLL